MTFVDRIRLSVTCTASNATVDTFVRGGFLYAIRYSTASASAFATGATATFSIAGAASGIASAPSHEVLTLTNTSVAGMYYPRRKGHTTAGATAADVTDGVLVPLSNEFVRLTVASGGANGRGVFDLYITGVI